MSNELEIYHGSPKELVIIDVLVNDVQATTGYTVCILPAGVEPLENDPRWQAPDVDGTDSGIFVGTDTAHVFAAGDIGVPWYYVVDSPESVIRASEPHIYFW